jgi:hypothetical protein
VSERPREREETTDEGRARDRDPEPPHGGDPTPMGHEELLLAPSLASLGTASMKKRFEVR